jgi:hypothetical protein
MWNCPPLVDKKKELDIYSVKWSYCRRRQFAYCANRGGYFNKEYIREKREM